MLLVLPPKKANTADNGPQKPWTRRPTHERRARGVSGPLSAALGTNLEQMPQGGEGCFFASNVLYIV